MDIPASPRSKNRNNRFSHNSFLHNICRQFNQLLYINELLFDDFFDQRKFTKLMYLTVTYHFFKNSIQIEGTEKIIK